MPLIIILDDGSPPPAQELQCDFCSSPRPTWRWRARSFEMPDLGWASNGDWAACDECNALMLANNWLGLLNRSAATSPPWPHLNYGQRIVLKHFIMLQHKLFRQNLLVGEPEAIAHD